MSILETRKLRKNFGGLIAVNEVDFSLSQGQITGLIGPNGAGKTTIINLVTGFLPVTSGEILFNGKDITAFPAYKVVQTGLSRTFQITQIVETFTVEENIMLGVHSKLHFGLFDGMLQTSRERRRHKEAIDTAREIIGFLGIESKKDIVCGHLPYGDKRIVELGRVLASKPKLILLDEPAAGLNTSERNTLTEIIIKIKEQGQTILLVEHDMKIVMGISDKVVVINFGQKIGDGTPDEIKENPAIIEAYLG